MIMQWCYETMVIKEAHNFCHWCPADTLNPLSNQKKVNCQMVKESKIKFDL